MMAYTTYSTKRRLSHKGETYISKDGVFFNGQASLWCIMSSRFERAVYMDRTDPKVIEFVYSFATRWGRHNARIRVPVPKASEGDVERIISAIKK